MLTAAIALSLTACTQSMGDRMESDVSRSRAEAEREAEDEENLEEACPECGEEDPSE
jgi:hypothetical protein